MIIICYLFKLSRVYYNFIVLLVPADDFLPGLKGNTGVTPELSRSCKFLSL